MARNPNANRKEPKNPRQPTCHPDRPYKAFDMCNTCYSKALNGGLSGAKRIAAMYPSAEDMRDLRDDWI